MIHLFVLEELKEKTLALEMEDPHWCATTNIPRVTCRLE